MRADSSINKVHLWNLFFIIASVRHRRKLFFQKKKAQEEMIELFFLFLFVLWMGGLGDVRLCSMVSRYDRDMPLIWQGHGFYT